MDDISVPANLRNEADGTISVVPGGGYNFHFWSSGRGVFADPLDVDAVFVTVKARLIVNDASLAPDFDKAVYVMSMGGDVWYDLNARWDYWKTNGDVGMGRFKRVKPEWQAFSMYAIQSIGDFTQTPAWLRANPPILE